MPATPRFKINDRVNKKRNTGGISLTIDSTAGTIIEMEEKLNSRKQTQNNQQP